MNYYSGRTIFPLSIKLFATRPWKNVIRLGKEGLSSCDSDYAPWVGLPSWAHPITWPLKTRAVLRLDRAILTADLKVNKELDEGRGCKMQVAFRCGDDFQVIEGRERVLSTELWQQLCGTGHKPMSLRASEWNMACLHLGCNLETWVSLLPSRMYSLILCDWLQKVPRSIQALVSIPVGGKSYRVAGLIKSFLKDCTGRRQLWACLLSLRTVPAYQFFLL